MEQYHQCGTPLHEPVTDYLGLLVQVADLGTRNSIIGVITGVELTSPRMIRVYTDDNRDIQVPAFRENFIVLKD